MAKVNITERSQLAQNIVRRRKAKNWSQGELAHRVGVHVNIIKKIEGDGGEGELATREAIAGALECTLADLYAGARDRKNINLAAVADFLSKISTLQPERRALVLALIHDDESYLSAQIDLSRSLGSLLK